MNTGRFFVKDLKSNRVLCVEPIENRQEIKVELQASETVVQDNKKHKGTITEKESIIQPENGFDNIGYSTNPIDYIINCLHSSTG